LFEAIITVFFLLFFGSLKGSRLALTTFTSLALIRSLSFFLASGNGIALLARSRLGLMDNHVVCDLLLEVREIFVGLGILLVLLGEQSLEVGELRFLRLEDDVGALCLRFLLLGFLLKTLELVLGSNSIFGWSTHLANGTSHASLSLLNGFLLLVAKLGKIALLGYRI
jgi:hypothetical protein